MEKFEKFKRLWGLFDSTEKKVFTAFLYFEHPVSVDSLSLLTGAPATSVLNLMEKLRRRGLVVEHKEAGRGLFSLKQPSCLNELRNSIPLEDVADIIEKLINHYKEAMIPYERKTLALADLFKKVLPTIEGLKIIKEAADLLLKSHDKLSSITYYDYILEHFAKHNPKSAEEASLFVDSAIAKAYVLMHRMQPQDQIHLLQKAKELAEMYNFQSKLALICLKLGRAFQDIGWYTEASEYIERFLNLANLLEENEEIKLSSHCLSEYYVWKGKFKEAIACYEKLLNEIEEFEEDENALMATQLIGFSLVLCGRVSRGLGMIEAVKEKAKRLNYSQVVNYCHQAEVISYFSLNRIEDARKSLENLLNIAQEDLGDILYWGVLIHKAYLETLYENYKEAQALLKKAFQFKSEKRRVLTFYPWLFETLYILERAGYEIPDFNLESLIEQALSYDDLFVKGVALRYRGLKHLEAGDEKALEYFLSSERYLRYSGAQIELSRTWISLGRYFMKKGEIKKAKGYLKKAWEVLSSIDPRLFPEDLVGWVSDDQRVEVTLNRIIKLNEALRTAREIPSFLEKALNVAMDISLAMRGAVLSEEEGEIKVLVSRNKDPYSFNKDKSSINFLDLIRNEYELVLSPRDDLKEPIICMPIKLDAKRSGCLYLEGKIDQEEFSTDTIAFIRMLCAFVSLAVTNLYLQEVSANNMLCVAFNEYTVDNSEQKEKIAIIGESQAIKTIIEQIKQVALTDATVLILGETGVGKELVARTIHNLSDRRNGPFIAVNLAAIPQELIASELFGHEKGAFTGAYERQRGLLELADGGTIFFDEIGDLPLSIQVKLLRVLEEGTFTRLGGAKPIRSNFRIIAATNKNLWEEVKKGTFRQDLYYRLNVFPIYIPPLRERKEDIIPLVNHFLKKFCEKYGKKIKNIPQIELKKLLDYHWPGNVRELKHTIERAVILSNGYSVKFTIGEERPSKGEEVSSPLKALADVEKEHIEKVLQLTGWRISGPKGAATILKVKPSTLRFKMKKLGVKRPSPEGLI